MYKIGEFSTLNHITIKTLRYYDEIGLLKPSIVDKYTGYRYYSNNQINNINNIKYYKELGLSLEEIKDLLNNNNKNVLNNKKNDITKQIIELNNQLNRLNNIIENNKKIELIPYINKPIVCKKITLKNKNYYFLEIDKVKKEIIEAGYTPIDRIISYLEIGFVDENIDTLVGYTVKEKVRHQHNNDSLIELFGQLKNEKTLVGHDDMKNIESLYSEMIKYANDNNIQIRGFATGVLKDNKVELYIEAYDLKEKNEDYEYYLSKYTPTKELDNNLVGTYIIKDILPDHLYMFNPNKQKNTTDTKYNELILNSDGTTNYKEINWNKKELVLSLEDKLIPLPIHLFKYDDKKYLEILMNESYEYFYSQRPMSYIYEKK
ncbi:MAG: MerR family transcriptional regulator [Bacilli bacterium]|nr:MerR family transcriptional regulator [Bacilli bacterium]MBR1936068.1 MerR family transcriptional regulator [Bacilli bacterium]